MSVVIILLWLIFWSCFLVVVGLSVVCLNCGV